MMSLANDCSFGLIRHYIEIEESPLRFEAVGTSPFSSGMAEGEQFKYFRPRSSTHGVVLPPLVNTYICKTAAHDSERDMNS